MDYNETRKYIQKISSYGSVLGLESIRELLRRLGNPQDQLKFIHIAGTNGKGSTLAFLSTILLESGYRVGRYLSPTVFCYEERFQVDGAQIPEEELAACMTVAADAAAEMVLDGWDHPTVFEVETAVAFLYFLRKKCDIVVLETGMGGSTDATNIVATTQLAVITSISMDHAQWLGNTLEEIARKKAGIMKKGIPVVSADQPAGVLEVLQEEAGKRNCPFTRVDMPSVKIAYSSYHIQTFQYKKYKELNIFLPGLYQISNAALAVEAVEVLRQLGLRITDRQLKEGLMNTRWPGRFTVLSEDPVMIMDGAHNPDAVLILKKSLQYYFTNAKFIYIMGVFADKEYDKMAEIIAPMADRIFTVTPPDSARGLPAKELAQAVRRYQPRTEAAGSLEEAVELSIKAAGENDVIAAFGSLSYLGELAGIVKRRKEEIHD